MIQKFFHRVLTGRHFWRYATFGEIAELYASRLLRMAALGLAGGFSSIYLYKNGFSVVQISLIWSAFFGIKVIAGLPLAKLVSIIGPKRGMFIGNIMYIPSMVMFAMLPTMGPVILIPVFFFKALSAALYNVSLTVDFSKVKSLKHAGKELAYMNIIEKLTSGIAPLAGGFIALWYGPSLVLVLSGLLFLVAALPLFRTGERVKLGRPLNIRSLPWHLLRGHFAAQMIRGYEYFMGAIAWVLFAAIFIIGMTSDDEIYAIFGVLSSVIVFVTLIVSYAYGRLIDNNRGGELMRFSGAMHSIVHLIRGFVTTPLGVAGLNVANEVGVIGYSMPYLRALFDNADRSGNRIAYLGIMESLMNLGASLAALMVAGLVYVAGDEMGLRAAFIASAVIVLLLLSTRFPLYRR